MIEVASAAPKHNDLRGYGCAALLVAVTVALKLAAGVWFARDEDVLFLAAVLLTARLTHARAALLAVALAAVCQAYFFIPPTYSFSISDPDKAISTIAWTLEGVLFCYVWEQKSRAVLAAATARENESEVRKLFAANPLAMLVIDIETARFLEVNDAACVLYGHAREDLVGQLADIVGIGSKEMTVQQQWTGGARHRKRDGSSIEVELVARDFPFLDRDAHLVGVRDVTQQQRLEAQLRQAQKMEAVGRLAGGIAHDFNNMLNVIISYAAMLLEDEVNPNTREAAEEIQRAAERSAEMTRSLLVFSRQQPQERRRIEVDATLGGAEKLVSKAVGETVAVDFDLNAPGKSVLIGPGQLEQIVMNLAINARDAMPKGGRVSISTRKIDRTAADSVRMLSLTVRDTGTGMDEATKARIFEPFFTTKEEGKGTGLGLSVVFGIVEGCGGRISVKSELGVGTTFEVLLPLVLDSLESELVARRRAVGNSDVRDFR